MTRSNCILFIKMMILSRRCVVIHDAPSFFFIDYKNRFIFFKLRYFEDFFGLCVRNI